MAGETSDIDPVETREWLESVDAVVESDGRERMGYLLDQAIDHAQEFRRQGLGRAQHAVREHDPGRGGA